MKPLILLPGQGTSYDWSKDHIYVKTPADMTGDRVTVVEDTLKPGFTLARHYHKKMIEIFYILDGEVTFSFEDGTAPVIATPGTTLNIPPNVWHTVDTQRGAKLLTIFSPGGFDRYLSEMAPMTNDQFGDAELMRALAEKYDQWTR